MTNIRKLTVIATLALTLSGGAELGAKTASWSVEPKYSNIEMLSPGTFLVKRGVYSSIIDGEGRDIVRATTDSITPFVENQALILTPAEDGRYRLQGILHDDFTTTPVNEEAYVDDYPFFSEGLLPVCNKGGFYGYMDPTGRLVLPMRYLNPRPFSEGYAAVIKQPKGGLLQGIKKVVDKALEATFKTKATTIYINRAGVELKTPKEIGKIYNATTFRNGTAYVENTKGEFFTINLQGQIVKRGQIANYDVDDHYALVGEDDDDADELTEKRQPQNGGVVTFTRNNLTGYRTTAGTIVLPAQFTDAEEFADGYALAEVNGKWGILKLEDGTFSGHAVAAARAKKGRKGAAASGGKFTVSTPQSYANESLTLTMDNDGSKNSESLEGTGAATRTYAMAAPSTGNTTVTLSTPNLVLWETHMIGSKQTDLADNSAQAGSTQKSGGRLQISISPRSAKADIKDNAAVTVTLKNPNDVAVSTTVRVSGNGLMGVNKAISIPAHGSRRVSTVFTKVFQKEMRTVTVSAGGRTASKGIVVNPFYVKF